VSSKSRGVVVAKVRELERKRILTLNGARSSRMPAQASGVRSVSGGVLDLMHASPLEQAQLLCAGDRIAAGVDVELPVHRPELGLHRVP
jgi:hypothetical protein